MLTRSGIHAIRAMVALASVRPGEYCGTLAIAEGIGAPRNYLGKLLLTLARRGLVESQKGLGGGFRLARDARDISLLEVVSAIDDVARWKECAFGGKDCSDASPCLVHSRWSRVRDAYMAFLSDTSLGELVSTADRAVADGPADSRDRVNMNQPRRPQ
jgi:Rrf2 family protein